MRAPGSRTRCRMPRFVATYRTPWALSFKSRTYSEVLSRGSGPVQRDWTGQRHCDVLCLSCNRRVMTINLVCRLKREQMFERVANKLDTAASRFIRNTATWFQNGRPKSRLRVQFASKLNLGPYQCCVRRRSGCTHRSLSSSHGKPIAAVGSAPAEASPALPSDGLGQWANVCRPSSSVSCPASPAQRLSSRPCCRSASGRDHSLMEASAPAVASLSPGCKKPCLSFSPRWSKHTLSKVRH